MKKRIFCLLLALTLLWSSGCASAAPGTEPTATAITTEAFAEIPSEESTEGSPEEILPQEPTGQAEEAPVETVTPRHYGVAMPYETVPTIPGVTITPYILPTPTVSGSVKPYAEYTINSQVPSDVANNTPLAYCLTVHNNTKFEEIPEGYDQDAVIRWGMSPGLNVDILHRHGFTGKGAVIAYIDQPTLMHPEFEGPNLHYTHLGGSAASMHGPSVISLLMGKNIGTAPEAEVYFYGHEGWKGDQATHAEALYALIEQNKLLPEGEKITMVGFSDNPVSTEKNFDAFQKAIQACRDSGVMVFFCGDGSFDPGSFLPMSDKNDYRNVTVSHWQTRGNNAVLVPESGRTTVTFGAYGEYTYWAQGGMSWAMPYVLGLYAIAIEIDPSLTAEQLPALLNSTAYENNGLKIVNPVGFVAEVLQKVGRDEEAKILLEEASYNRRYTYVLMNRSRMTPEDIRAAENWSARMNDTTVLIVDVSDGVSAQDIYRALQADAWTRDGIVEGVQILGTPDLVGTFQPAYRVQMAEGIDEMGTMKSDLFYGNFLNDAKMFAGYNVLDHFAQGWDVELVPCWSVARLPLREGEFAPFFAKYHAFSQETALERQDLVNFSNPIFQTLQHTDDAGAFLLRADTEFGILDTPYRLYSNQDGDYPVNREVLGNFTPENLSLENQQGICEFLINSHGQKNNIDQAIFQNGQEQRISFLNSATINNVLGNNPYYLDLWTCNGGEGMSDNLTTAALKGQGVGVFSATHVISNNGVNCNVSIDSMARSNFYYFYLNYLTALHQGASRSQAFFFAQQTYAEALMADSQNRLRADANYQFNLCNLLTYHNFGLLEPKKWPQGNTLEGFEPSLTGSIFVDSNAEAYLVEDILTGKNSTLHSLMIEPLEDGSYKYTLEFTSDPGITICAFGPPNEVFKYFGPVTTGERQEYSFTLSESVLTKINSIYVNFCVSDTSRKMYILPLP